MTRISRIRIGWLADEPGYKGGAELASEALIASAPAWAEVVRWPAGEVHDGVDAYVVQNCVQYDRTVILYLGKHPVIKQIHDAWPAGDPALKEWLLSNAKVTLFSSPLHRELFRGVRGRAEMVPNPIDAEAFRPSPQPSPGGRGSRSGAVWLGRLEQGKGIQQALDWADEKGVVLDFYGFGSLTEQVRTPGRYCGAVDYADVPQVLARYRTFVFLPDGIEPFGRTVVEAWLAGCELVINRNCGALWWLETDREALTEGAARFWRIVEEAVNDGA